MFAKISEQAIKQHELIAFITRANIQSKIKGKERYNLKQRFGEAIKAFVEEFNILNGTRLQEFKKEIQDTSTRTQVIKILKEKIKTDDTHPQLKKPGARAEMDDLEVWGLLLQLIEA